LLAETLLMEPSVDCEDRKTLTNYVDSFAAQIVELDEILRSQQQNSRGIAVSSSVGSSAMATNSRRGPTSSMNKNDNNPFVVVPAK
jgi:hypothetical protein